MLDNFYGNERTLNAIEHMLTTDRIPQTILLEGESGLGKRTVARAFAKSILCGGSAPFCDSCRSCTLFDAGTHPDYAVVKPDEKNVIRVAFIRELRRAVFERPDRSKRKVYVIENADCMNREAQNAFLKIMEEPPQYVVFLLLCTSRTRLLETVLSRCTVLALNPPPLADGVKALRNATGCDEEEAAAVLSACDGNIGKALKQLTDDNNDTSKNVEMLLNFVYLHSGYEVMKLMWSYSRDVAGLSMFLNLLLARTALLLRMQSMGNVGQPALSKQQLLRITDAAQAAERRIKENCSLNLLITCFCADIIK